MNGIARLEAEKQKCWDKFQDRQGRVTDLEGKPLKVCFSEAAVRDLGTYFKDKNGKIPTLAPPPAKPSAFDSKYWTSGQFDKAKYDADLAAYPAELKKYMRDEYADMKRVMEGTLMAGAQSVVDAAVLVHRLRRDSDFFRTKLFQTRRIDKVLDSIGFELDIMNHAMSLMPTMAAEMNMMNRNMSVMSYSMGSTAGRMGSMMPW